MIHQGDCLSILPSLPENSIDALVTDPPAGIGFMGKDWDKDMGGRDAWIGKMEFIFAECLRVMKPGAHGLVWALPRTSHWTAMALENAGFEIRDCVYHVFGQGFPKSLDISKAMDKMAGAEREVIGSFAKKDSHGDWATQNGGQKTHHAAGQEKSVINITAPATEDAKQWQGWGTALKPAVECWWLVRKPISERNVALNVKKFGVGGLNIDGCRIESGADYHDLKVTQGGSDCGARVAPRAPVPREFTPAQGRFPSHLILDEESARLLDEQSGTRPGFSGGGTKGAGYRSEYVNGEQKGKTLPAQYFNDSGGASRFFYTAKISPSERNAAGHNGHPTVKPQKLMRYLCKLITPPGGTILDPFAGSGSTGVAALSEGFQFIGIEREPEYVEIARKRLEATHG